MTAEGGLTWGCPRVEELQGAGVGPGQQAVPGQGDSADHSVTLFS